MAHFSITLNPRPSVRPVSGALSMQDPEPRIISPGPRRIEKGKTQVGELYCRSGPWPHDSVTWTFFSLIRHEILVLLLAAPALGDLVVGVNNFKVPRQSVLSTECLFFFA